MRFRWPFFRKSKAIAKREADAEWISRFFSEANLQNELAHPEVREKIKSGADIDELENAFGEFGRAMTNPIPVNGAIGELIYLSSLRTADTETPVIFQRLGSIESIDAYEVVNLDGRAWDVLYFDMYHPTRSKKLPSGYVTAWHGEHFYGVNYTLETFPLGLSKAIEDNARRFLGAPRVPDAVVRAEEVVRFSRPLEHRKHLELLSFDWVKVATSFDEMAEKIVEMAKRDFNDTFPKLSSDVGQFLSERGLMTGELRSIYEHRVFSLSVMVCIVARWYCGIVMTFDRSDSAKLCDKFLEGFRKKLSETVDVEFFDKIHRLPIDGGIHVLNISLKENMRFITPSFGIAESLFHMLQLEVYDGPERQLLQEFAMCIGMTFHPEMDVMRRLRMKYAPQA